MKKIKVLLATALVVGSMGFVHASNDVPTDKNTETNTNKTETTVKKKSKVKEEPKALRCKQYIIVEARNVLVRSCWFCKCGE